MSSARRVFLDTNVLLYLLSDDTRKADRAERLLTPDAVVSVQVLSEFTAVGRRKLGLSWSEIDEFVGTVRAVCSVEPLTLDSYDRARVLAERYRLSWYDALIAASALQAGCSTLYSEDFHHGLALEKTMRVSDPFR